MKPLVTIGIPVYNGENYLDETINSLKSQSYPDFRMVISDNCSTDGTESIGRAAAESDDRIEYHRQSRNLGAGANYNYLLNRADTEYFMWSAHDDLRHPGFLSSTLQALRQSASVSMAFADTQRIGPEGALLGPMQTPVGLESLSINERFYSAITCQYPDIVIFGLMRTQALRRTLGHGLYKGGDRILAAELALTGPFVRVPEPLLSIRDHPDRYTRQIRKSGLGHTRSDWWDSSSNGEVSFPRWKGYFAYHKAIARLCTESSRLARISLHRTAVSTLAANNFYIPKLMARELLSVAAVVRHRIFSVAHS